MPITSNKLQQFAPLAPDARSSRRCAKRYAKSSSEENNLKLIALAVVLFVSTAYAEEPVQVTNSEALNQYKSIPLAQRLHIILLGVKDVQKSAEFYDSLGWSRATDSHSGFVKYDLGGFAIALISNDDFSRDAGYVSSGRSGFPGIALIYLAKTEEDVKKILQKAVDSGGELVKPATVTPYGVAGYFRDPDGHLFEVDYEEKFQFTEDYQLITE